MVVRKIWKKAAEALARARTPRQFVVVKRQDSTQQKGKMLKVEAIFLSTQALLAGSAAYALGIHKSPMNLLATTFTLGIYSMILDICLREVDVYLHAHKVKASGKVLRKVGIGMIAASTIGGFFLGVEFLKFQNSYIPVKLDNHFQNEIINNENCEVYGFCQYKALSHDSWKIINQRRFISYAVDKNQLNDNQILINKTVVRQETGWKHIKSECQETISVDPVIKEKIFALLLSHNVKRKFITKFDK